MEQWKLFHSFKFWIMNRHFALKLSFGIIELHINRNSEIGIAKCWNYLLFFFFIEIASRFRRYQSSRFCFSQ